MIIPLDKLVSLDENRYIFTRASMQLVDRIGNIKEYPESDESWKVVPNIIKLMLDETIHYSMNLAVEQEEK